MKDWSRTRKGVGILAALTLCFAAAGPIAKAEPGEAVPAESAPAESPAPEVPEPVPEPVPEQEPAAAGPDAVDAAPAQETQEEEPAAASETAEEEAEEPSAQPEEDAEVVTEEPSVPEEALPEESPAAEVSAEQEPPMAAPEGGEEEPAEAVTETEPSATESLEDAEPTDAPEEAPAPTAPEAPNPVEEVFSPLPVTEAVAESEEAVEEEPEAEEAEPEPLPPVQQIPPPAPSEAASFAISALSYGPADTVAVSAAPPKTVVQIYELPDGDESRATQAFAATIGDDGQVLLEAATLSPGMYVLAHTTDPEQCGGVYLEDCRAQDGYLGETLIIVHE